MISENQHWIPRFLIRTFSDKDGRVFCFDKNTEEITKPPPKYVASAIDFYEFEIDGTAISFENKLALIEKRAAPVIRQIIDSCSFAKIDEVERGFLADFIAAQSFRTEAFYKGLEIDVERRSFGTIFAELWRSALVKSNEIGRRYWAVMVIEHNDVFYLGDQPIVLQFTEAPAQGGSIGIDVQGVEVFLPLSPKCALYMPCNSISHNIIAGYEAARQIHQRLRSAASQGCAPPGITWDALPVAQRVLRNSHALYESLTKGVPLVARPENVENLNYLQVAWAHSAIYSNQRNFSFAKRVLLESPQYRAPLKTSFRFIDLPGPLDSP
jgi:hypothetical protein